MPYNGRTKTRVALPTCKTTASPELTKIHHKCRKRSGKEGACFFFFALHVQRLRLDLLFDVTGQAFVFIVLVPEWLSCLEVTAVEFFGSGYFMFSVTSLLV